jgi:hypothetical protein
VAAQSGTSALRHVTDWAVPQPPFYPLGASVNPPTVLLSQLAQMRRAGFTFDESWPVALRAALSAAKRDERAE